MTLAHVVREWAGPTESIAWLNAELGRFSPRSESEPYLWAYWEPGDHWMPLERIVIARMTPRKMLVAEDRFYRLMGEGSDASLFSELEGPNPRFGGHYDAILGQFVHDPTRPPPTITERKWLLWRKESALAEPAWIVQGGEGGTPRRMTRWETELARVERRRHAPYRPGELPFAPADQRVVRGLMTHFESQLLSSQLSDDWFQTPEEERSDADRLLHARFDAWFADRNDDRASGRVVDASYNPVSKRVELADYTKI